MGRARSGDKRCARVDNSGLTAAGYQARMASGAKSERMFWWLAVGAVTAVGLVLRILAAQGGLWTDEAWSMVYAQQAGDPIGVFLRINHDNNHHLNSLWLQAVGMSAPPWLARLPAILAGTASVVVAALLAGSRWRPGGIVAATLFALSPALVTFGSEARGYALMILASLLMLLIATRAVERRALIQSTHWWLALIAFVGMLSHLTMVAPVALTTVWIYFDCRSHSSSGEALGKTARLMGPTVAACVAVVLFVFIAAMASPLGMRVGGYVPFDLADYATALDQVTGWSIGLSAVPLWLRLSLIGTAGAAVALHPPQWLGAHSRLYALLVLGIALGILLLRVGNASFARYYLTSLIGLLLLMAEAAGWALAVRGPSRGLTAALLIVLATLNLASDAELIRLQRGRPDGPIVVMAKLAPEGARVAVDRRFEAIVTVAAKHLGYRVQLTHRCEPAEFMLVPQPPETPAPTAAVHCGTRMRRVDSSTTSPISGDAWVLYAADLQTRPPPVSGPPPGAAESRRLSAERA